MLIRLAAAVLVWSSVPRRRVRGSGGRSWRGMLLAVERQGGVRGFIT